VNLLMGAEADPYSISKQSLYQDLGPTGIK